MQWWPPEGQDGVLASIRRARVQEVDDSGTQQIFKKMSGLASELPEDIYRPQSHGLSSNPPKDSEGLFLALGGRSDRLIALGFEHKDNRPKDTPSGQTVLYDDKGNVIFAKGSDGILIKAKAGIVAVDPGGKNVYLGGDGKSGNYAKVMTESGPSSNVYVKV